MLLGLTPFYPLGEIGFSSGLSLVTQRSPPASNSSPSVDNMNSNSFDTFLTKPTPYLYIASARKIMVNAIASHYKIGAPRQIKQHA